MSIQAILWDLDDTLLDTLAGRMRSLAYAYESCLGCRTDPAALWRRHQGAPLETLGQRLMGGDGHAFASVYRNHYYGRARPICPYPGIQSVLADTAELGIRHAVVTSKVAWGATDELEQAGLLRFMHAVVGYDDTDLHKPDPEPIYEALDRLYIGDPSSVAFVGDSPADIGAAHNAGCTAIGALWGTLDARLLRAARPDFEADRPGDIIALLEESGVLDG